MPQDARTRGFVREGEGEGEGESENEKDAAPCLGWMTLHVGWLDVVARERKRERAFLGIIHTILFERVV
jgi:hypothetical protein